MKDIRSRLNSLQLLHLDNNVKCEKYCSYPGCKICLCGKRKDAENCCELHKCDANNDKNAIKFKQLNENAAIHRENCREIKWLYDTGKRVFNAAFLESTHYNDKAAPVGGELNGQKVALFDDIAMWVDKNYMFHLEKINK